MISAIIFDLNKVLVTYRTDVEYKKTLPITQKKFWNNIKKEYYGPYCLGDITFEELINTGLTKAGIQTEENTKIIKQLHEKNLQEVPGIKKILEKLHKKIPLYLMAGEGKESLKLKLTKFGLKKYFKKIYCTSTQKLKKTDTKFYRLILKENNLQAKQTLFIDDREGYIRAAKKAGINTITFKDSKTLITKLKKYHLHSYLT